MPNIYKKLLYFGIPNYEQTTLDTKDGLHFKKSNIESKICKIKTTINNTYDSYDKYKQIINNNKDNPVIADIGKNVSLNMGCTPRIPIAIDTWQINNDHMHNYLTDLLGKNKGILDMWIKQPCSNEIIIPQELNVLMPILIKTAEFEKSSNCDFTNWNMWLLVDTRSIDDGFTQRNTGYHYDGLNISGKYINSPLVSIYVWHNTLPTLFYTGKTFFPDNFDCEKYNVSSYCQKQIKNKDHVISFCNYTIIKTDGASVHSANYSNRNITNRIFIRVCFTPTNMLFNRLGNTVNNTLDYPENFKWQQISDPSVRLLNCMDFSHPYEFKNMWDVACIGHPSYSISYVGQKSHQYHLITKLKLTKGYHFVKKIIRLYNKEIKNNSHSKNIIAILIWRKEVLFNMFLN